jgi:aminotransferase
MINIYQPSLGKEELQAIEKVFKSNWLGKGNLTEKFTKNLATKIDVDRKNIETCCSCTEALFQSQPLLGIGEGDEVILPSVSFVGAANAIISAGAVPVFCDVDERTLSVRAKHIEEKITSKTKAVLVLHYGGWSCEMDEILSLCKEKNIKVIEDNANSPFSTYKGKNTGILGDIGTWSFDAMKILVTGDGGLIYCKDENLIEDFQRETYLGLMTNSGYANKAEKKWWDFDIDRPGRRGILNDITAAIGIEQLKKIDYFLKRRQDIHDYYNEYLQGVITPPEYPEYMTSSYFMYWIQLENEDKRDRLAKYLKEKGIYTTFRYYPLHMVEYFAFPGERLKNTESLTGKTLCLPIHNGLNDYEVDTIIDTINGWNG